MGRAHMGGAHTGRACTGRLQVSGKGVIMWGKCIIMKLLRKGYVYYNIAVVQPRTGNYNVHCDEPALLCWGSNNESRAMML